MVGFTIVLTAALENPRLIPTHVNYLCILRPSLRPDTHSRKRVPRLCTIESSSAAQLRLLRDTIRPDSLGRGFHQARSTVTACWSDNATTSQHLVGPPEWPSPYSTWGASILPISVTPRCTTALPETEKWNSTAVRTKIHTLLNAIDVGRLNMAI
ncbi:Uncharacterized protein HZ326_12812 [Fusarium oxysporum f. sp. albedinis]|nr:Uncharacterized protein HZ326_12812 [Fusarium oxysporum f. sp. albedinis]